MKSVPLPARIFSLKRTDLPPEEAHLAERPPRPKAWQSWPWWVVYLPIFGQYLLNSLRLGSFTYPTVVNRPFMRYGGILEESKWGMYQKMPAGLSPRMARLPALAPRDADAWRRAQGLQYPLVLKPDCGLRGKGIWRVENARQLRAALRKRRPHLDYLVQEWVDMPRELGVFLIQKPGGWVVTSLMKRAFMTVTGDGHRTLAELAAAQGYQDCGTAAGRRLKKGERYTLQNLGNHRLGTRFEDARERLTPALRQVLVGIAAGLPGFEYGRIDLRFTSWEALAENRGYQVIEVNQPRGAGAYLRSQRGPAGGLAVLVLASSDAF